MEAKCEEVIITNLTLRGSGVEMDPYRRVVQVYTKDGVLLAEHDPCLAELLRKVSNVMNGAVKDNLERIIKHVP